MCLIKRVTTFHRDGRSDTTEAPMYCNNSDGTQTCENTKVEVTERGSGKSSQVALRPSSSKNNEVVVHQDTAPRRQEPRQERRYSSDIGVRFRGWFKSPEFSVRRLDYGGSGSGSRRRRVDSERWPSEEVMPEAPMPPPPARVHQSHRRSPPPSMLPTIVAPPDRPTPPQGPGAAAAFTTRDTVPSSSGPPSRASSSRSKDARKTVQDLPHLTVPAPVPSVTSNRATRSTPGLTRLRFDSNTRFRDSAYGSSNISPIDAPKSDAHSETRSNTTSERSASQRFNYANDKAVVRRGEFDTDDEEDIKSFSSGSRYRIVRRVKREDNPEETQRRMQEDMSMAQDYQSRTSEQGEGSVRSGSGKKRHRRRSSHE
jgi:hypothetical protein